MGGSATRRRRSGLGIVATTLLLAGGGWLQTHADVASWQIAKESKLTLLGSVKKLVAQSIVAGPGTPPKNWKTTSNLVLPRVGLAFGEYIDFLQNGTAQGVFDPATGKTTLDLPLLLRDSTGATQTFIAPLTTAQTNGVNSDGSPVCSGGSSDPPACRGTPRDASGSLRMVGIVNIPQDGSTRGSGAVLMLELVGTLTLSCSGAVCVASDACHVAGTCDPATGSCTNPKAPDGTTCDDGNACTRSDTCQSGTCAGSNPVTCSASDSCHSVGTCDRLTGVCSNPAKSNGTSCNDGSACTRSDTCQSGTCVGSNPVTCNASDACHDAGTCNPATGACSDPSKPEGSACNDGNGCTRTDTCQSGACVGSNPVVCTASDACHNVGTCAPATGLCSNPNRPNGTTCNDGNLCTRTDTCQSGVCTGSSSITCSASDSCHSVGTCVPATGLCSNPNKVDGANCNDGNACTRADSCQSGVCTGSNPVVCSASDACHDVGTCSASTGLCSNPSKADGTVCNDGNACTRTDACSSGTCIGSNPVTCTAQDSCHNAGTCNAGSGLCSNPSKANGTACDDGNACTRSDKCQSGTCVGSNPILCGTSDSCHDAGTCDRLSGVCSNPSKPEGTGCSDGNACTQGDACRSGVCTGIPVVCTASDTCHSAGTCSSTTGVCSNPTKPDGSACSDGNACTRTDTCRTGVCLGSSPVACSASDSCHGAGTCDAATGSCSNPALPDGTSCSDGNACTRTDTCQGGRCLGANPITCATGDPCRAGACDPATGICASSLPPDGTACDDGNPCTTADRCSSGSCAGVAVIPAEVDNDVRLGRSEQTTHIAWNPASGAAVFDLARGLLSRLPVGTLDGEACLGRGLAQTTTTDADLPSAGTGFWYLVRGNGPCGAGPYGFQGNRREPLTPRVTEVCQSGCRTDEDCPGTDTDCRRRLCSAGTCGFTYASSGLSTGDSIRGDCHGSACDGSGNLASVVDDTDVPVDGNPCTNDVCTNGAPSNPSAAGVACSLGTGTGVCAPTGTCAPCGGNLQRCCASNPYCRPGSSCFSGFCR